MTQRNQVIDLIRGFSILSVILIHCAIHLPIEQSLLSIVWVKILLRSGYYGVMVFFVVSGFLITSISIKRWDNLASINLYQFYKMRFARIMPCLFALFLISIPLHLMNVNGFVIQNTSLGQTLFAALTFQINRLVANVGYPFPANWDVLWSLSVEEVFYLIFPVLCILLRKQKHLIIVMLMFILIGPFARTQFTDNEIWSDHSYLSCMDGIAIGCLAAIFANKARSRLTLISLLTLGFILFSIVVFFRKFVFNLGITALGVNVTILEISIAFILIASQQIDIKLTGFAMIQWFGRNSYEIYLTHSFIIVFAANILASLHQPTWLLSIEYLLIVLSSGLLGQTIATYYSEPLNQLFRAKLSKQAFGYEQS